MLLSDWLYHVIKFLKTLNSKDSAKLQNTETETQKTKT